MKRLKLSLVYASQKLLLTLKYIPEFIGRGIVSFIAPSNNFCISNVPGPKKLLKFFDANIIDILPVTPHVCTSAMAILGCTYNGKFRFGLLHDTSAEFDSKKFSDMIQFEIDSQLKN